MKKCIVILLLVPLLGFSQEKNKRVEFNSISLNPLSIYLGGPGGFSISGDIGLSYKGNDFLVSGQFGEELNLFGSEGDSFAEISLSWGKKSELTSWLQWEGFVGLSYFNYKRKNLDFTHDRSITVGVPFITKLKFMIGNSFSIGTQVRINMNTVQSVMSGGLSFQVDF
ncbi:hypothetical protein [Kordia sp.]|uniref:hypothetical protein n=1 Tax=Kordia sp. TaxID=1965332 RepID=UPI0025C328BD|nr:hypothetical protein [Kordia sp.]MCH2196336.1 hypothetical protein [Kordia sp.]